MAEIPEFCRNSIPNSPNKATPWPCCYVKTWNLPWTSWDEKYDDDAYGCPFGMALGGVVTVKKIGSSLVRKDCIRAKDGRFTVGGLPAGTYQVHVRLITPGLDGARYLKDAGKRLAVTVRAGATASVGARHVREARATARGTVTMPTAPHGECTIALIDAKGKNRTAATKVRSTATRATTKVSYFVWAKDGTKRRYAVRAQCSNNNHYYWAWFADGRWQSSPRALGSTTYEHPITYYSGSVTTRAKATKPIMAAGVTKTANFTVKKWRAASVGTPTLSGSATVGHTLRVKVPGRAAKSGLAVAWFLDGHLSATNIVHRPGEGEDAYQAVYRFDRMSYPVRAADAGKSIQAKILIWQSDRWTVARSTTTLKIAS